MKWLILMLIARKAKKKNDRLTSEFLWYDIVQLKNPGNSHLTGIVCGESKLTKIKLNEFMCILKWLIT